MTSRRFVIDTDTASDDAVALIMALQWPDVDVEAVTVVAGNVGLEQASRNARYTLELCEREVPVYEGCDRPLLREPAPADWFHGTDGMGNQHYPEPQRPAAQSHAVDALSRLFAAQPGELELITLGPLTNVATALTRRPQLAQEVAHCYVMGGAACTVGNVTPAAEYNIWCDPEAAQIVLRSGMPITMIGWELSCDSATLDATELAAIRALDTARAHFAVDCNEFALEVVTRLQKQPGLALADPVAMAIALNPAVCTQRSQHAVTVVCDSDVARGMTVVDKLGVTGQPANAEVCWQLDAARWKSMLAQCLA